MSTDSIHMRIVALQRSATQISARFKPRVAPFYHQACANFEADYTRMRAEDPTFSLTETEKRREIERMRQALVEINALRANLASQQTKQQTKKSRQAHGRDMTALTSETPTSPTTKLVRTTSPFGETLEV